MRLVSLVISLLVAACAISSVASTNAGSMTSQAAFEALRSDENADGRAALAAVEREPGAYLPSVFGGVARELLETGRVEDALVWDRFGMLRMMEDIEFAGRISDRADHMSLALLLSYQTDEGEALIARMQATSLEERRSIAARVAAISARYPRQYAPTWVLGGRARYEQNFGATPTVWSAEDLAAMAEIHTRVSAEMAATDAEQAAQR